LRPRLQRRLAAIVAVDVVGFSLLVGRDEEGAVGRLSELQARIAPIVEARGGRTANTAGDSMLLEFSSPVAAVECAIAIQRTVDRRNSHVPDEDKMRFRIGINVGEVIDRGDDVFGDVVNVASRLEAIAAPGGICVSHAIYAHCRAKLSVAFVPQGEMRLKNILKPVRTYGVRP
jgi:adenylate cyclase